MSFGNERAFIDHLQSKEKEGKAMKCPLLMIGWNAARGGDEVYEPDCLKEECAWWHEGDEACAIKVIAAELIFITISLGAILHRMPPARKSGALHKPNSLDV